MSNSRRTRGKCHREGDVDVRRRNRADCIPTADGRIWRVGTARNEAQGSRGGTGLDGQDNIAQLRHISSERGRGVAVLHDSFGGWNTAGHAENVAQRLNGDGGSLGCAVVSDRGRRRVRRAERRVHPIAGVVPDVSVAAQRCQRRGREGDGDAAHVCRESVGARNVTNHPVADCCNTCSVRGLRATDNHTAAEGRSEHHLPSGQRIPKEVGELDAGSDRNDAAL